MGEQLAQSRQNLLLCANLMRREAKLCDIVLYVQNKRGLMVGYPAHKLVLINSSRYFKGLFERESLQQYCHFPSLTEDGLFTLLDIIYGHDISPDVKIEDALYAAKYLQVESAVDFLENKLLEQVQAPSEPYRQKPFQMSPSMRAGQVRTSNIPHSDRTSGISNEHIPRGFHHSGFSPSSRKRLSKDTSSPIEPKREPLPMGFMSHGSDSVSNVSEEGDPGTPGQAIMDTLKGLTETQNQNEADRQETMIIKVESDEDIYGDDQEDSLPGSMMGSFPDSATGQLPTDTSHSMDSGGDSFGGMEGTSGDFHTGFSDGHGPVIEGMKRCGICGLDIDVNNFQEHLQIHGSDGQGLLPSRKWGTTSKAQPAYFDYRPYQCSVCGRGFGSKHDMKRHMLVHTGERPHRCDVCGKTFTLRHHLKGHSLSIHGFFE